MEAADIPDSLWRSSSIGVLRPPKIAESDFLVAFRSTEGSREHGSMAVISSVKVKYDKTLGYFTDTGSAKRIMMELWRGVSELKMERQSGAIKTLG